MIRSGWNSFYSGQNIELERNRTLGLNLCLTTCQLSDLGLNLLIGTTNILDQMVSKFLLLLTGYILNKLFLDPKVELCMFPGIVMIQHLSILMGNLGKKVENE